jgi:hypothetical protein
MPEQSRINLLVEGDRKARWQEAVETNPEYDNLSHLIRSSVERELSTDTESGHAPAAEPGESTGELRSSIEDLRGELEGVATDLERLRDDVDTGTAVDLQRTLLQIIPEEGSTDIPEDREGLTAGEIAGKIGVNAEDISPILAELSRDVPSIHRDQDMIIDQFGDNQEVTIYYQEGV